MMTRSALQNTGLKKRERGGKLVLSEPGPRVPAPPGQAGPQSPGAAGFPRVGARTNMPRAGGPSPPAQEASAFSARPASWSLR